MLASASWKYVNKGLLGILGIFIFATIASILFLSYTLLALDRLITRSTYSISTALTLQELLISIKTAESNAGRYILTGEPLYEAAYRKAAASVVALENSLNSADQVILSPERRDELGRRTVERMAIMEETINQRTANSEVTVQQLIREGKGSGITDDIQSIVTSVTSRSIQDSGPRHLASQSYLSNSLWVAGLLSVFVVGICVLIAWYFHKTIFRERALESTKNEFLSLASHQLRTPATNVKQYLGMLLDGYLGDLSESQQKALKVAYKNNESEIRIMNDLLDVAKVDLQRIHLQKQPVDAIQLMIQVVRQSKPYALEHGQTLVLLGPKQLRVSVDRTYFKGIIENLIDNAMKYSKDKTRVEIKIKPVKGTGMFEITVKDNGLGIRKRELPKLFMKFSRLSNEFSANTEGSGLGLYWVKKIVALHGGNIHVSSHEGSGSKFVIQMPIE